MRLSPTRKANIAAGAQARALQLIEIQSRQWTTLQNESADNSSEIILENLDESRPHLSILLMGLVLDTDASELRLQVSSDGGLTFLSTPNYEYNYKVGDEMAQMSVVANDGDDSILLTSRLKTIGNAAGEGINGAVEVLTPMEAALFTEFKVDIQYDSFEGRNIMLRGGGRWNVAEVINAVRIYPSAGLIVSGSVVLEGRTDR